MFGLLEKIVVDTHLVIEGRPYSVLSKALYTTESNSGEWYAKIVLTNHSILVIDPSNEVAYIGKVSQNTIQEFPAPEVFSYNNQKFNKIAEDDQVLKEVTFGNKSEVEGALHFADYVSKNGLVISLGINEATGQHADVIARYVKLSQIRISDNS